MISFAIEFYNRRRKKESCGNPITTCFHGSYPLGAPNIHLSLQKKMLRGNICFRDREDQQPQDDDAKDDEPHGKHAGRSNLNLACAFFGPFLGTTFQMCLHLFLETTV